MNRVLLGLLLVLVSLTVFSAVASANEIPVGVLNFDQVGLTSGEFDITNQTGSNSFPPFYPVTTGLTFTITDLTVNFVSGPPTVLTAGDFLSDGSGGWLGNNVFSSSILNAVLVGTLSPTSGVAVDSVGTETISADLEDPSGNPSVTLSSPTGGPIAFGDVAVIYASTTSLAPVPEPQTGVLLGTALVGLIVFRLLMGRNKTRPNFA